MVKSHTHKLDSLFHALSDATRRAILRDLGKNEKTVSQLAKPYNMSLAAVSKHLKVLEEARLVNRRKEGSFQYVRLNAKALQAAGAWLSYYQKFWSSRLDALQELLENKS